MADKPGLLLNNPHLVKRVATLFAELNESPALQTVFINSPDGVIGGAALPHSSTSEQVSAEQVPAEQVSAVNRFIFSVLASEESQHWLQGYRSDINKRDCRTEQKLQELARAFVQYGALKLSDDAVASLETDVVFVSNISRTYVRTLNNRVTVFTRIKVNDPPQISDRRVTSMQVVSMAEQLLHRANGKQTPAEGAS
jgi:hypothetical protein